MDIIHQGGTVVDLDAARRRLRPAPRSDIDPARVRAWSEALRSVPPRSRRYWLTLDAYLRAAGDIR